MKKRIFSLLLAVAVSAVLLAGCGSRETLEPPVPADVPQPSFEDRADAEEAPAETDSPVSTPEAQPSEPAVSAQPEDERPAEPSAEPSEEPAAAPEPSAEPAIEPESSEEPVVAPQPSATPSPKPSASALDAQSILNAAPLSPMKTNDAALDAMVENILDRIITDGMTTYEKVKACYDYLIDNTVYQTKDEPTVIYSGVYVSDEDYKNVLLATEVLSNGKGVCDHYAAALHVLTRRIGLESYICTGKHHSQRGGMGGHVWTIITVNGTDYIFDAQVDDTNGTNYARFCKTFAEMGDRYQDYNPANNKAQFSNFRRASSPSSSSSGYGGAILDAYIFSNEQAIECYEQSMAYTEAVVWEANQQVRIPAGLPEMTADPEAVKVAYFCADNEVNGYELSVEEVANFLLMQGVDFRYVVAVPMGEYVDPTELVLRERDFFSVAEMDGFAAGVYGGWWHLILYGG